MVSVKLCWEPAPRTLHHQRENGPTTHVISYLDELAVCVPTLEAWDQMVWPTTVAILCVPTKAKSYGYCWGQAVDLGPVMPAAQFHVTQERGTYLCTMRALVFKGSILTYNPTLNEAEWVPAHSLANTSPGLRRGQPWPWPTMYCTPEQRQHGSQGSGQAESCTAPVMTLQ